MCGDIFNARTTAEEHAHEGAEYFTVAVAEGLTALYVESVSYTHLNPQRLRFMYNCYRFTKLEEIGEFKPELVINAATVKYTLDAFHQVLPVLPKDCIISDIASVKTGLKEFYENCGFRYVSTHPMFGPTFANLDKLSTENAIIIKEGDLSLIHI